MTTASLTIAPADAIWVGFNGMLSCNRHSSWLLPTDTGFAIVPHAIDREYIMPEAEILDWERMFNEKPSCESCGSEAGAAERAAADTSMVAPAIGPTLVWTAKAGEDFTGLDYIGRRLDTGSYTITLVKGSVMREVVFIQDGKATFLHPENVNITSEFIGSFNIAFH